MHLHLSVRPMRRVGWFAISLLLGIAVLLLYIWFFRYFTESAQFLTPTSVLLCAIISVIRYAKTRHHAQVQNGYGRLSVGMGLGIFGLSWLGHWSTMIVSTTILRGEAGEVVNVTHYDLAFYADRYIAFLALVLFIHALLSFFRSTQRAYQPPDPWCTTLAITVIVLSLWLVAHIDDATAIDILISYVVWLLYGVTWCIIGVMIDAWFTASQAIRS